MTKQIKEVNKSYATENQVVSGALIGIAVIALVQLISVQQLDIPLKISLYCFAISIPSLSLYWLNAMTAVRYKLYVTVWHDLAALFLGALASVAGVCALFWHFSWIMGVIFLATSFIGFIAWEAYEKEIKSVNVPSEESSRSSM